MTAFCGAGAELRASCSLRALEWGVGEACQTGRATFSMMSDLFPARKNWPRAISVLNFGPSWPARGLALLLGGAVWIHFRFEHGARFELPLLGALRAVGRLRSMLVSLPGFLVAALFVTVPEAPAPAGRIAGGCDEVPSRSRMFCGS